MAKSVAKKKETAPKKTAKAKTVSIAKLSQTILDKLKSLHLEPGLQSDIVWCLGSYDHDKNPVGLYEKAAQALVVLKAELAKKTKGITAKLIADIEKALPA